MGPEMGDIENDPKVCMKVLRLLLIGGLMILKGNIGIVNGPGRQYVHAVQPNQALSTYPGNAQSFGT